MPATSTPIEPSPVRGSVGPRLVEARARTRLRVRLVVATSPTSTRPSSWTRGGIRLLVMGGPGGRVVVEVLVVDVLVELVELVVDVELVVGASAASTGRSVTGAVAAAGLGLGALGGAAVAPATAGRARVRPRNAPPTTAAARARARVACGRSLSLSATRVPPAGPAGCRTPVDPCRTVKRP